MKLTNKQHTDYCEILNDFRCKAIDIIDNLTKEYKDTLAEDIDAKLNNYKQHNEELIVKICQLEQNQNQKAIECLKDCEYYLIDLLAGSFDNTLGIICAYIDTKIKELEGGE